MALYDESGHVFPPSYSPEAASFDYALQNSWVSEQRVKGILLNSQNW